MSLILIDGFDHYGDDETKMTEGVYDSVDSDFALSTINARTGSFCIRRNSNQSDARIIKYFDSPKETVGAGLALYMSALPSNDSAYAILSFIASNGNDEVTFVIDSDGSIKAVIGDVNGTEIASSDANRIDADIHNHIEIGVRADSETEVSSTFVSTWDINTLTKDGNLLDTSLNATSTYFVSYDGLHVISSERASFPFDGRFHSWTLSMAFDLTSATKDSPTPTNTNFTPSGLYVSPDGLNMYINDRTDDVIRQYSMSTAYDLSTLSLVYTLTSVSGASFYGCFLTEDGLNLYFCDNANNVRGITHYTLSPAWDLSSATHEGYFDINSVFPTHTGVANAITGRSDGTHLYVFGISPSVMYDIELSDPTMLSTATIVDTKDASLGPTDDYCAASDGSYFYGSGPIINRWVFETTSLIDNSDGIVEVRVNGVTELSVSNAMNTISGSTDYSGIAIRLGSLSNHGVTSDMDDLFIWDDNGAWNNSFLGDRRCYLLKPNGDTNIADFDPSSGSFGYKMIDDDSPDDDSTYIIAEAYLQTGSPLSGTSEFKIEDLINGTALISGVNVIARAAKTDSTSAEIYTSIVSGSDTLSSDAHALTTSYAYYSDIFEYDPSSISSMTRDQFNGLSISITADDMEGEQAQESPGDVVSPSQVLWTPAAITTNLWLDASDSATITLTGGVVSQWDDKSGNNRDATQGTAGSRPAVASAALNGLDVIRFDGSNDFMSLPSLGISGSGNRSLFIVVIADTSANNGAFFMMGGDSGEAAAGEAWRIRTSTHLYRVEIQGAGYTSSLSTSAYGVFAAILDGTTVGDHTLWLDGSSEAATGASTVGTVDSNNRIGASTGGANAPLDGDIAEIVLLDSAASTDTRQRMEGYLAHKWGLEANLPGGHPYKTSPPEV